MDQNKDISALLGEGFAPYVAVRPGYTISARLSPITVLFMGGAGFNLPAVAVFSQDIIGNLLCQPTIIDQFMLIKRKPSFWQS